MDQSWFQSSGLHAPAWASLAVVRSQSLAPREGAACAERGHDLVPSNPRSAHANSREYTFERSPSTPAGCEWWAHLDFTRVNVGPIILEN
jgi:hypothetical protein